MDERPPGRATVTTAAVLIICAVSLPAMGVLILALCWAAGRADKREL